MVDTAATRVAELAGDGLIAVTGADARSFLHAQLTSDIARLGPHEARRAGWCSAQGRLLVVVLVLPRADGFLLHLPRELVPTILKRLQMFVLRAKVTLADASGLWSQWGLWGDGLESVCAKLRIALPAEDLALAEAPGLLLVRIGKSRCMALADVSHGAGLNVAATAVDVAAWTIQDIRDGLARIGLATQDLFVPQMVNLERVRGVDFQKGCYPGQEVVARTQYRGQLKRRMVRLRSASPLQAGQTLYAGDAAGEPCGTVVNAAGGEALAVVQIATLEGGGAVRADSGGPALELLPLPGSD